MRGWTMAAAAAVLFAAGLWHWPATAQKAPSPATEQTAQPAGPSRITFEEYRDFRLHSMARRQAQLTRQLAAPDLSAAQKATLEGKMAYYDRLTAMSPDARDKLFRSRFDQIDTNHDGTIDAAERAAWREKQHASYAQFSAGRPEVTNAPH
ncbi:MAG TPA: EF-hand domain-containing protein [Stellaceae bacterium]